jgi:hypothetical protein
VTFDKAALLVPKKLGVVRMSRWWRNKRDKVINQSSSQETNEPSCLEKTKPDGIVRVDSTSGDEETSCIDR